LTFLVGPGIVAGLSAERDTRSARMNVIPMAALAAPVYKTGFFQLGNQLSQFSRPFSIRMVSYKFAGVNAPSQPGGVFVRGGAQRLQVRDSSGSSILRALNP